MLDDSTSQTSDRVRRLLIRATSRAAIPYLLSALLPVGAVVFMGHEVVKNISAIEAWLTGLGTWGVVAFVVLFVASTSFLMPDSIFCIAAGALFGLWWGTTAVLLGILLSATLQFYFARRLFHDGIQCEIGSSGVLTGQQALTWPSQHTSKLITGIKRIFARGTIRKIRIEGLDRNVAPITVITSKEYQSADLVNGRKVDIPLSSSSTTGLTSEYENAQRMANVAESSRLISFTFLEGAAADSMTYPNYASVDYGFEYGPASWGPNPPHYIQILLLQHEEGREDA